jgi:hypothetical protein
MGKMSSMCRAVRFHVSCHMSCPCVSLHVIPRGSRGFIDDSMGVNRPRTTWGVLLPRCVGKFGAYVSVATCHTMTNDRC